MMAAMHPRRIWICGAVLASLSWAGAAWAQDPNAEARALQVIGSDAHARLCGALVSQGDTSDRTVETCTRALGYRRITREANIQVLINRGVTYMRRQENAAALADFDAAIALDRRNGEAFLNRGAALVQMGQPGPAVAAITEALGLGVSEPHKAYFNRGAARERLGDLRGAYEDYSTALDIQPDWGPANAELARFARARREHLANALAEPGSN